MVRLIEMELKKLMLMTIFLCRFTLGQVMESLEDFNVSADCMSTALQLEPSCPVLPFTSINLTFE